MGTVIDMDTKKAREPVDAPCECEDGHGQVTPSCGDIFEDLGLSSYPFPWRPKVVGDNIRVQLTHKDKLDWPITEENAGETIKLGCALVLAGTRKLPK